MTSIHYIVIGGISRSVQLLVFGEVYWLVMRIMLVLDYVLHVSSSNKTGTSIRYIVIGGIWRSVQLLVMVGYIGL